ncbi:MAG: hypothetical protein U1F43_00520 [Myxococcota bacterium]
METLARYSLADDEGCHWLGGFPAGSVDALVLDPPSAAPVQQLAFEAGRVLGRGRRGFWICESKHGLGVARLLQRFGLDLAQPVIWDRGESARGGRLRWILPLSRGRVRGLPALPDLVSGPGAGLPDAVAELLVMMSSVAGQWIIEPFASAPALAQTAIRLGRPWAGSQPLAPARAAITSTLTLVGARASELPVRWNGTWNAGWGGLGSSGSGAHGEGGGVPVGAGSELATQLALEPAAEPAVPAAFTAPAANDEWSDASVRGPAADPDELRTSAV